MDESDPVVEDAEKVRVLRFRSRIELVFTIGVLFALYVVVGGVLCLFRFAPEIMDWEQVAWSLPVCAAVAALFLSVGVGLFRRRDWARKLGMVLCWVSAAVFVAMAVRVAAGGCSLVLQPALWEMFPMWHLIAAFSIMGTIAMLCAYAMARIALYLRSDEAKALCREDSGT